MIQALKRFYSNFGDRGVLFIMFAFSVVAHSLLSLDMELPAVNPDEIGVASVAAFYSGKDWSALMSQVCYYYGYIQALFYAPLFMLFNDPYSLYKACLVMNGVLISFIPLIAYHIASKLGISKVWQKVVIAFCCGSYITYIAHSKFIWNEAICSLLPWVLMWVMFMAMDSRKTGARIAWSACAGVLCAICYASHTRMLAVAAAFVVTLLAIRIFMRRRILVLPVFFPVLALSFVGEHFIRQALIEAVWKGNALGNTLEYEADKVLAIFTPDGLGRFICVLFGNLYTFATSTIGLGAFGCVLFFVLTVTRIKEWRRDRNGTLIDGVKVYEPASKHIYSARVTALGIYAFLSAGTAVMVSVLFKFNSDQYGTIKDLVMFGRYTDNIAPIMILLVLVFLFRYGITLRQTACAALVYGGICAGFFTLTYGTVNSASGYRESPVLGLQPWRIGEDITQSFTADSFIIMTSVTFSFMALAAVFSACTKKSRKALISGACCCLFTYTTVFTGAVYLPQRAQDNLKRTEPARMVSSLLYDEAGSPLIAAYNIGSRNAGLIQFLNLNTRVTIVRSPAAIPENCILITDEEDALPIDPEICDYIGTEGGLTAYACGETARDYIRYKRSADTAIYAENENSEVAEPDIPEI